MPTDEPCHAGNEGNRCVRDRSANDSDIRRTIDARTSANEPCSRVGSTARWCAVSASRSPHGVCATWLRPNGIPRRRLWVRGTRRRTDQHSQLYRPGTCSPSPRLTPSLLPLGDRPGRRGGGAAGTEFEGRCGGRLAAKAERGSSTTWYSATAWLGPGDTNHTDHSAQRTNPPTDSRDDLCLRSPSVVGGARVAIWPRWWRWARPPVPRTPRRPWHDRRRATSTPSR